jgi:hypothetical protein
MRAGILALLVFSLPALAQDAKPACGFDASAVIQCETGGRTFRVIRQALSRTGRYAVAWALVDAKDKDKIELRNGEQMAYGLDVENVIIHLPDGAQLKTLPGDHFGDAQRYNHKEHFAHWSDYDLWVVVANDSKWQTDNANVYSIDDNDGVTVIGPLDLMAFCTETAHKFFLPWRQAVQLGELFERRDGEGGDAERRRETCLHHAGAKGRTQRRSIGSRYRTAHGEDERRPCGQAHLNQTA